MLWPARRAACGFAPVRRFVALGNARSLATLSRRSRYNTATQLSSAYKTGLLSQAKSTKFIVWRPAHSTSASFRRQSASDLAEELWDSVDPTDVTLSAAQADELDRRRESLRREGSHGRPWREALEDLRKRG